MFIFVRYLEPLKRFPVISSPPPTNLTKLNIPYRTHQVSRHEVMGQAKYKHCISCHKRACLLNRHFSGPKCARLREVRCIYLYSSLLSFAIFYPASMNQALSSEADNLSFFSSFSLGTQTTHAPPHRKAHHR